MNKSFNHRGSSRQLGVAILIMVAAVLRQTAIGAEPSWWTALGVENGAPASDYAVANQGQAKWFALQADIELQANLPAGFNSPVYTSPLPSGDNYAPINQGQLKNLVQPLYDRINQALAANPSLPLILPQGMSGTYPWSNAAQPPASYAPVNLGQFKYILSFDFFSPPPPTEPPPPPTVTIYCPSDETVTYGQDAYFSVYVSGTPDPVHYQWQKIVGDTIQNVGSDSPSYTVEPSVTDSGSEYYVIITSDNWATTCLATLTVTPAPLTITANDQVKELGQTLAFGPGSTQFTSSGLQNGETIGTVTLTSSGGAASAPIRTYSIIPSAATAGTFSPVNYSITYVSGTLTVQYGGVNQWTFPTGGTIDASPAIGPDGTVYIASMDGNLYSINPANGHTNWFFQIGTAEDGSTIASPVIDPTRNVIYVTSGNGNLYALEASSGSIIWTTYLGGVGDMAPAITPDGSTIYVTIDDGNGSPCSNGLEAINASDGSFKWILNLPDKLEPESSPVAGPDCSIYFMAMDEVDAGPFGTPDPSTGKLLAVSSDGNLKWSYPIPILDEIDVSPAIDTNGTIYVCSWDGGLYAVNTNGLLKWRFDTGTGAANYASPSIDTNGNVYFGDWYYSGGYYGGNFIGQLFAVNPQGIGNAIFTVAGGIQSTPAIGADGTIYVTAIGGYLYALQYNGTPGDGTLATEQWQYPGANNNPVGVSESSPAIGTNGTVYFGSEDDNLYAVFGTTSLATNSPWPMFRRNPGHTASQNTSTCATDCGAPFAYIDQYTDLYTDQTQPISAFVFSIFGQAGTSWHVYQSDDLANWTLSSPATVTLDANGQGSFSDNNVSGKKHCFYQLTAGTLGSCSSQVIGFITNAVNPGYTPIGNQLIPSSYGNTLFYLFLSSGQTFPAGTAVINPYPNPSITYTLIQEDYDSYSWEGPNYQSGDGVMLNSLGQEVLLQNNSGSELGVTFVGIVPDVTLLTTQPIADPQMVNVTEGMATDITLTGTDWKGLPLAYTIVSGPQYGSFGVTTAPNLTYTPYGGYVGPDQFTFKVNNGTQDSLPTTILININAP
jgi:outer membrane protein assembly factor BamB